MVIGLKGRTQYGRAVLPAIQKVPKGERLVHLLENNKQLTVPDVSQEGFYGADSP